jgi:hypothetical protein
VSNDLWSYTYTAVKFARKSSYFVQRKTTVSLCDSCLQYAPHAHVCPHRERSFSTDQLQSFIDVSFGVETVLRK